MTTARKNKGEINYLIDLSCYNLLIFFNDFDGFYFSGCSSHVHRFGFSGKIPYRLPHPLSIFVLNQEKLPRCHLSQLETRIQRSANDVCYYHSNPVVEKTRWSKFDSYFFWGEVPKPTLGGRAVLCIHKESGVNPWSNKQKNYAANLLQTVDCARLSSKSGVILLKILEYLVFLLSIDLSNVWWKN